MTKIIETILAANHEALETKGKMQMKGPLNIIVKSMKDLTIAIDIFQMNNKEKTKM